MIASAEVKVGHVLDVLAGMPAGSVHSCITSPPYWGLRDYKLEPQVWGGDAECNHQWAGGVLNRQDGGPSDVQDSNAGTRGSVPVPFAACPCGAWRGHLGLEPTIDLFLDHLLLVFDAVKRVLRDDACAFINLGDSYAGSWGNSGVRPELDEGAGGQRHKEAEYYKRGGYDNNRTRPPSSYPQDGLKPLDLCNVPHRFALRMQAAGWYLRSTIVWAKGVSFCDSYSGSVMPESLSGTRWERCRVKVGSSRTQTQGYAEAGGHRDSCGPAGNGLGNSSTDYTPCPGCPTCEPNGGYVLRRGSWRPTSAYEYVFMFAKSARYYSDGEGVREEHVHEQNRLTDAADHPKGVPWGRNRNPPGGGPAANGRNLRNVWPINPQPFPDAHFATFPEALVEPLIKCSTSDKGVCPECGAPWARCVEREHVGDHTKRGTSGADAAVRETGRSGRAAGGVLSNSYPDGVKAPTTLGWRPTCGCPKIASQLSYPDSATVLDPFLGSGTTLLVARKLGRNGIGIELSEAYAEMARQRIAEYAPLFSGDNE